MSPMPPVGRKASSLALFGVLAVFSLLTALGSVAAQDEADAPLTRIVELRADETECDAGNCRWDTPVVVVAPGETLVLVANLTNAEFPHNIHIGPAADEDPEFDVVYDPAKENADVGSTQDVFGRAISATFTAPEDFEEIEFFCTLHQPSMTALIAIPAVAREAGGEPEAIHHLGVNFLAYWVGLIAFAVLFIVYGITFFLFKYNETSATTDQWDRSGAGAPEVKSKMSSGNATLIAIVLGIVALAAVVYLARMG